MRSFSLFSTCIFLLQEGIAHEIKRERPEMRNHNKGLLLNYYIMWKKKKKRKREEEVGDHSKNPKSTYMK